MFNEDKEKLKYRELKEGLDTITNKVVFNGGIKIPKGSVGKIVHTKNKVKADIWFYNCWNYKQYLNVEIDYFKPTQFRGIVLTLDGSDFSIVYKHNEHSDILFNEKELLDIPYLNLFELNYYENNEKVKEYKLIDIINNIEKCFSEFVNELEVRSNTKDDSEDIKSVFTSKSLEVFEWERYLLLESFSKVTGIYYNFMSGTIIV